LPKQTRQRLSIIADRGEIFEEETKDNSPFTRANDFLADDDWFTRGEVKDGDEINEEDLNVFEPEQIEDDFVPIIKHRSNKVKEADPY